MSAGSTNYTYDAENRMSAVSGADSATFVYDGDGNRVKGVVGGVTTTYIGNYFEWSGSTSTMKKYYYAGGTRVAERVGSSSLYWLLTDHLGSTSITATSSGSKTAELRYKPWGETRYTYGTTPTSQRYTGQREESSLGLYWYNSRWYASELSRFIQPDTYLPDKGNPQGLDRYAYVANNPISRIDTGGNCWGIASFIRGLPTYTTTCENLDMALTIIQSDETSLGEKVVAGGYIAAEGLAHGTLAAGGAMLACSINATCAAAAETILHIGAKACADGDCTNEGGATSQAVQSVWQMRPFERGVAIENMLGRSPQLAQNFPVINRWNNGVATSIKSIDLMAKSYQNTGTLTRTIQGYINTLANWEGARWNGVNIIKDQITARELILAIPPNASQVQLQTLQQLQQQAADRGVTLIVTIIK